MVRPPASYACRVPAVRPRARDVGLRLGRLPPGSLNAITDVPGVRVGHASVIEGADVRTGVTAVVPHPGDPFLEKTPAAVFVLNAVMLWLTSALSGTLGLGFHVSGFWAAFWGALVVSIVSTLLSLFISKERERE